MVPPYRHHRGLVGSVRDCLTALSWWDKPSCRRNEYVTLDISLGLVNVDHSIPIDYAVVLVGAVFVFASVSWIVSARKWFKGPIITVERELSEHSISFNERKDS